MKDLFDFSNLERQSISIRQINTLLEGAVYEYLMNGVSCDQNDIYMKI